MFLLLALLPFGLAIGLWLVVRRRRIIWKIGAAIGAALLCWFGSAAFIAFLFGTLMCGRYDFPPAVSPDGRKIANVTENDCGAVDNFHSKVIIKTSAFNFGFRTGTTIFSTAEDPRSLEIEWIGPHEVVVRYPENPPYAKEFYCRKQWKDVKITCISFPREFVKPLQEMPPVHRGIW